MEVRDVLIVEQNFWRAKKVGKKLNVEIKYDVNNRQDGDNLFTEFVVNLRMKDKEENEEEVARIGLKLVGSFDVSGIDAEEFKKDMAPKIVFTYAKKKILAITQEAGIAPIGLPSISTLKEQEKIKKKLN